MKKFKVGDRVKKILGNIRKNQTGVVVGVRGAELMVRFDCDAGTHAASLFMIHKFELVKRRGHHLTKIFK